MPTTPGAHGGRTNGWPTALSAASSAPDDRNVSTVTGPSEPNAVAYAGGHPSAIATTWANVRVRTRQRCPTHASSSCASGRARQIARSAATTSLGTSGLLIASRSSPTRREVVRRRRDVPPAERRGLDAVLARRRAEAPAGVPRAVEEDLAAVRSGARPDAVGVTEPDDAGQALGADRCPHRDELGVGGVVVQPPRTVLLGEVGVRRVEGEERVEPAGGRIELVPGEVGEDGAQLLCQREKRRDVAGGERRHGPWVDGEDPCELRLCRIDIVRRGGQRVDQRDGGHRAGVQVTAEFVLTSHGH